VDAPAYIEEIVKPTIVDFEKHPYSRRHAFLACLVTFHTLDYIQYSQETGYRRNDLRKSPKHLPPLIVSRTPLSTSKQGMLRMSTIDPCQWNMCTVARLG
jgi:hypothetical protein